MLVKIDQYEWAMGMALELAEDAYKKGEVPVGAVVLDSSFRIIAKAFNNKESSKKATGHAEILAIEEASTQIKNWRLEGCSLVVTLEPCLMCLGAMTQSRIANLIFGAYDPKGGAISLGYPSFKDPRLNHRFSVVGGILQYKCGKILSSFFKERRSTY